MTKKMNKNKEKVSVTKEEVSFFNGLLKYILFASFGLIILGILIELIKKQGKMGALQYALGEGGDSRFWSVCTQKPGNLTIFSKIGEKSYGLHKEGGKQYLATIIPFNEHGTHFPEEIKKYSDIVEDERNYIFYQDRYPQEKETIFLALEKTLPKNDLKEWHHIKNAVGSTQYYAAREMANLVAEVFFSCKEGRVDCNLLTSIVIAKTLYQHYHEHREITNAPLILTLSYKFDPPSAPKELTKTAFFYKKGRHYAYSHTTAAIAARDNIDIEKLQNIVNSNNYPAITKFMLKNNFSICDTWAPYFGVAKQDGSSIYTYHGLIFNVKLINTGEWSPLLRRTFIRFLEHDNLNDWLLTNNSQLILNRTV